ncbi:hypothetical protein RXV86_17070 [Alisedimentitalea sp. MJ-SS2]|uniref:hypothetical protein n=1 Tax=Aliisedimentitalea sp. MJ-SS2 TaxID=3049795 RepID=UPI002906BF0A|nr:hypothetical protein [Alisedimentitalea sp. MJ-SS2]MDU8929108.1 hypothetical protein [Alisedimentitalea sp. MJ-SS2]
MQFLIWGGSIVTLLGVAGLLYVGVKVGAAKRDTSDDEALRTRIQGLVPLNLAALFVSAIGLMMVVIGIALS